MGCGQSKSNQYQIAQPADAGVRNESQPETKIKKPSNNVANNVPIKTDVDDANAGKPILEHGGISQIEDRSLSQNSKKNQDRKGSTESANGANKAEGGGSMDRQPPTEPLVEENETERAQEQVVVGEKKSDQNKEGEKELSSTLDDKGVIIDEVDTNLTGQRPDHKTSASSGMTEKFREELTEEKVDERNLITALETVRAVQAANTDIRRKASIELMTSENKLVIKESNPNSAAVEITTDKELGLVNNPEDETKQLKNGENFLDVERTFQTPRGSVKIKRNSARNSIFIERDDGIEREVIEITNSPNLASKTDDDMGKKTRDSSCKNGKVKVPTQITNISYPLPQNADNVLSKVLNPTLYSKYCDTTTKNGHSLDRCIQTGVDYPHLLDQRLPCLILREEYFTNVFIRAVKGTELVPFKNEELGTELVPFLPNLSKSILAYERDCYYKFPEIFDAVIQRYQPNYQPNLDNRPNLNPAPLSALDDLGSDKFCNTRLFAYRNVSGFQFLPGCTRKTRREIESVVTHALNKISSPFKGTYYSIMGLTSEHESLLESYDLLINRPSYVYDKCLTSADWPESRGVWLSNDKNLAVLVNELEHLKIVSLKQELRFQDMFRNLCDMMEQLEDSLLELGHCYVWSFSRGYMVSNPCYIGNAFVCETLFNQDTSPQMEVEDLESIFISNVDTDKYKLVFDTYGQKIRIQSLPVFGVGEVEQFFQFFKFLAQISQSDTNVSNASRVKINLNENNALEFPLMVRQKCIISKVLTPTLCVSLYEHSPEFYGELLDMINIGIKDTEDVSLYPDGLICRNKKSYDKYDSILNAIAEENNHVSYRFWKSNETLTNFDNPKFPFDEFISDFFIMTAINISSHNFVPFCNQPDLVSVLQINKEAFAGMEPKFNGDFYDFSSSQVPEINDARVMSLLYPSWDPSKSFFKHWPNGRAFWISKDRSFLCWINETDHFKFFAFANEAGVFTLWDKYIVFVQAYHNALKTNGVEFTDRTTFPTLHRPINPFHLGAVISTKNENLNYLKNLLALTGFQIVNLRINESSVELWVIHVKGSIKEVWGEQATTETAGDVMRKTFIKEVKILMSKMSYLRFLIKHSHEDVVLDDAFKELKVLVGKQDHNYQDSSDLGSPSMIKSIVSQTFNNYPHFLKTANVVIATCLTPDMYAVLSDYRTVQGFSLDDCIRVGCDNQEKHIAGMIALDEECYDLYGDLVDCLIRTRSKSRSLKHVIHEISYFPEIALSLDDEYIYYLELGLFRNLQGFPLVAGCNLQQLARVEELILCALDSGQSPKLKSNQDPTNTKPYTRLDSISEEEENDALQEFYEPPNSLIYLCPQLKLYWPRFRGRWSQAAQAPSKDTIKESDDNEKMEGLGAAYFVNTVDHLQAYWTLDNHNVWCQFHNIYTSLQAIESALVAQGHSFMKHSKYGYVTTCPLNLGSGISIKIRYKLPHLLRTQNSDGENQGTSEFVSAKQIIYNYNLRILSYDDETLEVITSSCYGYSEVELFQQVIDCSKDLIRKEIELKLAKKNSTTDNND